MSFMQDEQLSPRHHRRYSGRQSPRDDMRRKLDLERRLFDYGLAVQQMQTDISRAMKDMNGPETRYQTHQEPFHYTGNNSIYRSP